MAPVARTTQFGIRDIWLAGDGPVIVAHGHSVVFQRPGAEPQTLDIEGDKISPSTSHAQVLIQNERTLTLLDWSNGIEITRHELEEPVVLANSFSDHTVYVAANDRIDRLKFNAGSIEVDDSCECMFAVALHHVDDELWVKGSTLGAARYYRFALPSLELADEGTLPDELSLRSADKLAMKQVHVGDTAQVDGLMGKTIPLEWALFRQDPPLCAAAVYLIESSVDDDNTILPRPVHYLTAPSAGWRYPINHELEVYPVVHAVGRFVAIGTGTADTGQWAVIDLANGEELGVRSRPHSDVPRVRICGNHLAVGWTDGDVEVVGLPGL